jgi:hypothetical protein
MNEIIVALTLAVLGLTIQNMRCIRRVERDLLYHIYNRDFSKHDLEDK